MVHKRTSDLANTAHPSKGETEDTREEHFRTLRELPREHVGSMNWSFSEGLQLLLPSLQMDIQLPAGPDGAPVRLPDRAGRPHGSPLLRRQGEEGERGGGGSTQPTNARRFCGAGETGKCIHLWYSVMTHRPPQQAHR